MPNIPETVPHFVHELLDNPPRAGTGVHAWLFRVARQLHAHMPAGEVAELLADCASGCGRPVPWREIVSTVRRSQAVAWTPKPGLHGGARLLPSQFAIEPSVRGSAAASPHLRLPFAGPSRRWPDLAPTTRRGIIWHGPKLADLWEASPLRPGDEGAAELVEILFPGNPLLCCGASTSEFDVKPRQEWGKQLAELSFIVPSPMTAEYGVTQEGKRSKHTLANTGPRRYLVCEFDQGTPDEHAALLLHLSAHAPLVCAVHSGGKSLHGWFNVEGEDEEKTRGFFRHAVSLGADPATWTRSQFVRMPGGMRENGKVQMVCYLNPAGVCLAAKTV